MGIDAPDALYGIYRGIVTNVKDPTLAGRIKVAVPGVVEPETNWCRPVGMPGSGSTADGKGFYWPPSFGQTVMVFFQNGDVDSPFYFHGPWSAKHGPGVPWLSPADADKVMSIDFGPFSISMDARPGNEKLTILYEKTLDGLTIIANKTGGFGVLLHGTESTSIESTGTIHLNAPVVKINGRLLLKVDGTWKVVG